MPARVAFRASQGRIGAPCALCLRTSAQGTSARRAPDVMIYFLSADMRGRPGRDKISPPCHSQPLVARKMRAAQRQLGGRPMLARFQSLHQPNGHILTASDASLSLSLSLPLYLPTWPPNPTTDNVASSTRPNAAIKRQGVACECCCDRKWPRNAAGKEEPPGGLGLVARSQRRPPR